MDEQRSHCLSTALEKQHIGQVLRLLHHRFGHRFVMDARAEGLDDVSIMHGHILGFLSRNADKEIFQRDIEREFHIKRSTVTGIMQVMEKNGYIERHSIPDDCRLKRVCLTPKGEAMHQKVMTIILATEERARMGISPEQLQTFAAVAEIIEQNLK